MLVVFSGHGQNRSFMIEDKLIDLYYGKLKNKKREEVLHPLFYSHVAAPEIIVNQGDPVLVMGYPLEFYDKVHNLPITRIGHLASAYGAYFNDNKHFLIDANLHPGTSGSPVIIPRGSRITTEGIHYMGKHPPILIGINSGEYSNGDLELGLHSVWYSELIQEII